MSLTNAQIQKYKNTKLSANFTLFEMLNSSTYPSLVTAPSEAVEGALAKFAADVLQPIRDYIGPVKINSGWRNKSLNAAVGGVYNSVHRIFDNSGEFLGVAADIVPLKSGVKLEDLAKWIYKNIPVKTVIIYRKPNVTRTPFLHVDTRVNRKGKALLEKVGSNKYVNFEG